MYFTKLQINMAKELAKENIATRVEKLLDQTMDDLEAHIKDFFIERQEIEFRMKIPEEIKQAIFDKCGALGLEAKVVPDFYSELDYNESIATDPSRQCVAIGGGSSIAIGKPSSPIPIKPPMKKVIIQVNLLPSDYGEE